MILKVNLYIIWSRQSTLKMFPLWFFCFSLVLLGFLLPVLFSYFIAGEKCNFQVKFALVHPVCKNWLKLGKAKTSFFFRYTLGRQTSKFTHKYLLENMQKFPSLQFIWRYVYKSVKWIKMGSKLIRSHSESEHNILSLFFKMKILADLINIFLLFIFRI